VDHAGDLSNKSGLHVVVIAPPPEVFDLADIKKKAEEPPLDDAQEPVAEQESPEPTPFNFHDGSKRRRLTSNYRVRFSGPTPTGISRH
jgi:hypothetical protein